MQKLEKKTILFNEQEQLFKERTGDDFVVLYTKYYPKLVYFTNKICNDQFKAEDIATDSFMTAFDKIDKYNKEKSQFSTWLFTIAKNIALQELKVDKKTISLDVEYDGEGTTMKDFLKTDDCEMNMNDIYDMKADIMKKHINSLKKPYKEVIEMRELQKMSYKEIAEKLNLNLSSLKSRIRMGRQLLIKSTEKEFTLINQMYK